MYLVLSRFSVGGVLYLTCIPLPLAWWHQHDVTSIAKWCGQSSSWLLAIWHSLIAKSLLAIWRSCIAKALLTIWCSCISKCTLEIWRLYIPQSLLKIWSSCILKWCSHFGDILLLSSNDRVSSFYWIRGSKHCFLTSFSYLNCYFLFSSIFKQSLLTSLFAPFSAAQESGFLSRFLIPLVLQCTMLYVRPHISGTHHAFSWSKMLAGTWY